MRPNGTANELESRLENNVLPDVIGMWQVKHRVARTVVAPLLAAAAGDEAVSPPSGVLLHGPQGCGVGFIARLLAEELAESVPVHLVEDLDALASTGPDLAARVFEPAGAEPAPPFVVATSHRPWSLPDWAFGAGRIDRMVLVTPPDRDARRHRLDDLIRRRARDERLIERLLDVTPAWTARDLVAFLDDPDVDWDDHGAIVAAASTREPSVMSWLTTARSLAVFAPERGMMDDLVAHLQRYRLG